MRALFIRAKQGSTNYDAKIVSRNQISENLFAQIKKNEIGIGVTEKGDTEKRERELFRMAMMH
jgi:hypothetical protein